MQFDLVWQAGALMFLLLYTQSQEIYLHSNFVMFS